MSIMDVSLAFHPPPLVGHVNHSGIEVHLPRTIGKAIPKGHKQQSG